MENTKQFLTGKHHNKDHLHMCGEYDIWSFSTPLFIGSPPHVWRILRRNSMLDKDLGITSTCVENTSTYFLLSRATWDHLHMCGEYGISSSTTIVIPGSPPHVWRIPLKGMLQLIKLRITSTCVENTVNKSLYSAK